MPPIPSACAMQSSSGNNLQEKAKKKIDFSSSPKQDNVQERNLV